MPRNRERQLVDADAAAVVSDLQQHGATTHQFHFNRPRAAINRVFQQLLQRRRRSFNDFTRRDLVNEVVRQCPNLSQSGDSPI